MNIPLWISSTLVLDARKAVWLPKERTLAVADLLLGQAGGEGELNDETVAQLLALVADYQPEKVVLLGDTLAPQAEGEALTARLKALLAALRERAGVVLVHENPTSQQSATLKAAEWLAGFQKQWHAGKHLLYHGEAALPGQVGQLLASVAEEEGRLIIGYEQPALSLGDGVATRSLCPCFLLGRHLLVLPAFSPFATLNDVRPARWRGGITRSSRLQQIVAIAAGRLLPLEATEYLL